MPTMTRRDLIWLLVLAEISDDYEEPEHIYERVARRAEICGTRMEPDEVRQVLKELVNSGFAKVYRLSPIKPIAEVGGFPSVESFEDYYYYITPEGKDALAARRDQWPLDGEDNPLPGWTAPAADR